MPVVESALAIGYRHIDGAAGYNNEEGVGRALAATGYNTGEQRESLWMTTKLRDSEQGYDSAMHAFDRSLELLQLDYGGHVHDPLAHAVRLAQRRDMESVRETT